MQAEAPEAVDLSREKQATRDMYGIGQQPTDEYGRNCLIARRLVERGVRFIQLYLEADISRTPGTGTRVLRKTTAFTVPRWINPSPRC